MIRRHLTMLLAAAAIAVAVVPVCAESQAPIRVGVTIAQTGPAASLGIPQRNSVVLLPREIAGHSVQWIVLDDGSDATKGVSNTRKLIDQEMVDVIIGSSTTPVSLAMIPVVAENRVPMISLAASAKLVDPKEPNTKWVFKDPQNDSLMADAIAESMAKNGIKTVGFIGFNDAYGDSWLTEASRAFDAKGIKILDTERYARTDTSVTGQTLKLISAKPEAVLIAASGTPAALPEKALKERGYAGKIYQTHGIANPDFLRIGGKDVEGTILPAGPVLVADQLPEDNPIRKVAQDYVKAYEGRYGAGTMATFGAHLYDAALLLEAAIPQALQKAQPGTPEFRAELRDALEGLHGVVLTHGIATMSDKDHNGFDQRARVMVTIKDGKWVLLS